MKRNQKRLIQLLLVLLFLLLLFVIKLQPPQFLIKKPSQPFSMLSKEKINELLIIKDKTTSLVKKNKLWYVKKNNNEFPADQEKIGNIINAVIGLKKEEVVSTNKNKHKEFGIDKQKIEIKSEAKKYVIFIGNSNGLDSNYVRLDNENEVFTAGGFTDALSSDDYRDLNVHLINDETKVTSINILYNNIFTLLVKSGNDWKIGNTILKKDRVDFFLNDLKTLKAKDILKKQEQENYQTIIPELSITIKENNKEKNIGFYLVNDEDYFAVVSPSNFGYQVASAYVASLKKEEKDFVE